MQQQHPLVPASIYTEGNLSMTEQVLTPATTKRRKGMKFCSLSRPAATITTYAGSKKGVAEKPLSSK